MRRANRTDKSAIRGIRLMLCAEDFWQFSLKEYAKPEVQKQLLERQEAEGANVNLALLYSYLTSLGIELTKQQMQSLDHEVSQFNRQFTSPLRQLRKSFKEQCQDITDYSVVRQGLLDVELILEKQEQQILISWVINNLIIEC